MVLGASCAASCSARWHPSCSAGTSTRRLSSSPSYPSGQRRSHITTKSELTPGSSQTDSRWMLAEWLKYLFLPAVSWLLRAERMLGYSWFSPPPVTIPCSHWSLQQQVDGRQTQYLLYLNHGDTARCCPRGSSRSFHSLVI